jgi:hypothetical protein
MQLKMDNLRMLALNATYFRTESTDSRQSQFCQQCFGQVHPARFAESQHDERNQHLDEDGYAQLGKSDEKAGVPQTVSKSPYVGTELGARAALRSARKSLPLEPTGGILAEREDCNRCC